MENPSRKHEPRRTTMVTENIKGKDKVQAYRPKMTTMEVEANYRKDLTVCIEPIGEDKIPMVEVMNCVRVLCWEI